MRSIRLLSTICITLSLCGFVLLGLPLALSYFPSPVDLSHEVFSLSIPKINAQAKIVPSVDPWNQEAYSKALKVGVAQAKGSGLPTDEKGMYLFAHSSLPYLEMIKSHPVFFRLGELQTGDHIYITYNKKEYVYTVMDKKVIWPTETEYLTNNKFDLVLQTCTPPGTDFQRLLIFAKKS